ncbi:MAG: putative restriction endonuclease [Frankiales bacterium]|jgi:hypothetical protein|nr:putative restriction endonuclease [Frankiales bacterium]
MPDGSFLVSAAKGIFKPAPSENPYALSIRIMFDSPYRNGPVMLREDGSFFFWYHQEGGSPAARDTDYANRALMRCIEHGVPVGVLRQLQPVKASDPPKYDVLGLATPVGWIDGYFVFAGHGSDGPVRLNETFDDALLAMAARDAEQSAPLADPAGELPTDDADDRRRVTHRLVVPRRSLNQSNRA